MKKYFFYEIENKIYYNIYENDNKKDNKIMYFFNNQKIENVLKLRNYLKENYNINLFEIIN